MFSSTMVLLVPTMMLMLMVVDVEGKELERFSRKGKVVSQEEDGNIAIELRRKRWEEGLQYWTKNIAGQSWLRLLELSYSLG